MAKSSKPAMKRYTLFMRETQMKALEMLAEKDPETNVSRLVRAAVDKYIRENI